VYYPACCGKLFAYHGISGRPDPGQKMQYIYEIYELMATEEAFRTIWKQGVLYSYAERVARGDTGPSSMIFGMDKVAGDDEFVFLTVCKPHSVGHRGYHLVFDPYQLVDNGAQIGLWDLQSFYMAMAEHLGVQDRNDDTTWTQEQIEKFVEDAEFVKSVWRISDGEAVSWLRWIQGLLKKSPVNANALRYVARMVADIGYHNIRWLSTDRKAALGRSELLVSGALPLDLLVGVIFRGQWMEIEDFVRYYGPPGSEPPPALEPHQAIHVLNSNGYPIKCPKCQGWMNLEPLVIPESSWAYGRVWRDNMMGPGMEYPIRVMVCGTCKGAFGYTGSKYYLYDDPFIAEEYIGQIDDMEYVQDRW